MIFVAKFRPESETKFVTCGFKHVKFWTLAGTQLIGRRGVIPKSVQADLQTMLSVAFASVSLCVCTLLVVVVREAVVDTTRTTTEVPLVA